MKKNRTLFLAHPQLSTQTTNANKHIKQKKKTRRFAQLRHNQDNPSKCAMRGESLKEEIQKNVNKKQFLYYDVCILLQIYLLKLAR